MTVQPRAVELTIATAKAADNKKGEDAVVLDIPGPAMITGAFVLVNANNERLVAAVVDEIEDDPRNLGAKPVRREGVRGGRWVLLDYGDTVVHIFCSEEHDFYGLDRLWRDCPRVKVEGIEQPNDGDDKDSVHNTCSIDEIPLTIGNPDTDEF